MRVRDKLATVLLTVHSNGTHKQTIGQATTQATAKVEKVRRPTISSAGSSQEWSYFLTHWKDYTKATKLEGEDTVKQLLECCKELRKDLTRNAGGSRTNKSVDEVMTGSKKLAVREENAMVAPVQLHNMHQDRDETIRSFGARGRPNYFEAVCCSKTKPNFKLPHSPNATSGETENAVFAT